MIRILCQQDLQKILSLVRNDTEDELEKYMGTASEALLQYYTFVPVFNSSKAIILVSLSKVQSEGTIGMAMLIFTTTSIREAFLRVSEKLNGLKTMDRLLLLVAIALVQACDSSGTDQASSNTVTYANPPGTLLFPE